MFQYLNRSLICSLMLSVLAISTQAQASVFDYPRDASYSVIEYSQSHDMILNADPLPMLRIYGNGRVLVHFPAYMKRAGDYEMYLADTEIQQLLSSLEQKGILKFSNSKLAQIKKQAIAGRLAESGIVLSGPSDNSRSRLTVNLNSYTPGLSFIPQYDYKKEVVLKNLKYDAQLYPGISELQNAVDAEQELQNFLTHRDLIKIK